MKKKLVKVLIAIISLYGILWALYGLELWHSRNAVIKHYGGIGYICAGGPVAPPGTIELYKTEGYIPSYLEPFYLTKEFNYSISTKNGGYADGYVGHLGNVHETSLGEACLSQ